MQILENDQKTTSCKFWRRVRFYANFGQTLLNRVQQSHSFLWHFGFYVAHCTHLRKGKYFVCVKYISNFKQRSQVHCSSNGQFEKMYRVQKIWRWETTSASIMESLFWRLQPQNADSLVLTTLLELLYVWSGDGGCYNIACCFFSSQSCILWAAFSPRDLVSGGACFLKCASWRITPLECLWEGEGESINPRQIFHLFKFSGSTLNWDYRFCHNHLSPKFGSILRSVILISSLLIKSTIC